MRLLNRIYTVSALTFNAFMTFKFLNLKSCTVSLWALVKSLDAMILMFNDLYLCFILYCKYNKTFNIIKIFPEFFWGIPPIFFIFIINLNNYKL